MRKVSDERVGRQSPAFSESQDKSRTHRGLTAAQVAALKVAQTYPVFPCDPTSKRPLTKHGFKEATIERGTVERWWQKYPGALVGVPTGAISGLLAVDCDPEGLQWFEREKRRLGHYRLHQTRRGKHLLYQMNGEAFGNSAGLLAQGVDTRGEGGYVIWWPAHGGVAIGEPGEIPDWIERRLSRDTTRQGQDNAGDKTPVATEGAVSEGGRDDWLSRRAYALVKAGWGNEKILQELRALNAYYCTPPLEDKQVRAIARGKRKFQTPEGTLQASTLADEDEVPVDWLWKGFLARNKVHVIAGAGATMKSTLTLSMAATITSGGEWPDGSRCPKGSVILWTGEDDIADTVKPRFRWAGGDQKRCHVLKGVSEDGQLRPFDPAQDIAHLVQKCEEIGDVALIIIDPIVVVVQKDNNSVSDVRRALFPLQKLAESQNCVILGIQHFNKGSKGKDPVERITGSGAWSQAPRIVLATAPIVDGEGGDPTHYVFACVKTFAKKQGGGYEYTFEEEPHTEVARTVWGKRLEGTGQSILMEAEGGEDGESKLSQAKRFLTSLLENKSVSALYGLQEAGKQGIRKVTLDRARASLGIDSVKVGSHWRWMWSEGCGPDGPQD